MLNTYFSVLAAATANTADSQAAATSQLVSSIVMLVVIMAIFYFMLIRPQKKKDKEQKQMRDSLQVGDQVTTIGGIVGFIPLLSKQAATEARSSLRHGLSPRTRPSTMSRTSLERKSKSKKAAFERCFFCAGTDKLTVHFHIPKPQYNNKKCPAENLQDI